jgi:hypothetical protein
MRLGEVLTADDREWIVRSWLPNGSYILAEIPVGENAMGMGRTWDGWKVPTRTIMPPHQPSAQADGAGE